MRRSTYLHSISSFKCLFRLLHEFYIQQRPENSDSLCATYLVSGRAIDSEKPVFNNAGRDDIKDRNIRSSPFLSSPVQRGNSPEERPYSKTVTLVRKHDLEGGMCIYYSSARFHFSVRFPVSKFYWSIIFLAVEANYQELSSIHIYSLGPTSIQVRMLIRR